MIISVALEAHLVDDRSGVWLTGKFKFRRVLKGFAEKNMGSVIIVGPGRRSGRGGLGGGSQFDR